MAKAAPSCPHVYLTDEFFALRAIEIGELPRQLGIANQGRVQLGIEAREHGRIHAETGDLAVEENYHAIDFCFDKGDLGSRADQTLTILIGAEVLNVVVGRHLCRPEVGFHELQQERQHRVVDSPTHRLVEMHG